jgi:hypothetical protein
LVDWRWGGLLVPAEEAVLFGWLLDNGRLLFVAGEKRHGDGLLGVVDVVSLSLATFLICKKWLLDYEDQEM